MLLFESMELFGYVPFSGYVYIKYFSEFKFCSIRNPGLWIHKCLFFVFYIYVDFSKNVKIVYQEP